MSSIQRATVVAQSAEWLKVAPCIHEQLRGLYQLAYKASTIL